jgi:hypothetical protein
MTRRVPAFAALLALAGLLAFDLAATPPNPYAAPFVTAFGSGISGGGGFCGALPD